MGVGEKANERRKEKEEALAEGKRNLPREQGEWERGGAEILAGAKRGLEASGVKSGGEREDWGN